MTYAYIPSYHRPSGGNTRWLKMLFLPNIGVVSQAHNLKASKSSTILRGGGVHSFILFLSLMGVLILKV